MAAQSYSVAGLTVWECSAEGPLLTSFHDIVAEAGEGFSFGQSMVVVPVERLVPEFFQLRTGIAGELLQKAVNYRVRLAIVGEVPAQSAASSALRDLIRESNRGDACWFLGSADEVKQRLLR